MKKLSAPGAVVFADQALGALNPTGRSTADVDLLPDAERLLERLTATGTPIVIVLPEGSPRAERLELPVDARTLRAGRSPVRTLAACEAAIGSLEDALVVAADRVVRGAARSRGCRVAAHPALAQQVLDGIEPVFLSLKGGRPAIDRLAGLVPYWLERDNGVWTALGAGPPRTAVDAVRARLEVDVLALDLALEEPLIVRVEAGTPDGRVVTSGAGWALYAMGPDDSADALAAPAPTVTSSRSHRARRCGRPRRPPAAAARRPCSHAGPAMLSRCGRTVPSR